MKRSSILANSWWKRKYTLKHLAPLLLTFCLFLAAAPLAAKESQPQFNTIVVKHFANADGMNQSQEFINDFAGTLSAQLLKLKVAQQVLGEDVAVTDAVAANSLVIEGKFVGRDNEIFMVQLGKLNVEIDIYRISDHALVKAITTKVMLPTTPSERNDTDRASVTASQVALKIQQALKGVDLSSIPLAPSPAASTTPAAATAPASPAAAPSGPEATASVQFSSDPSGAEIAIDGNYAGSTTSVIKLKPGTHSIRITKKGYTPWERSIDTAVGESRTIAADLDPAKP